MGITVKLIAAMCILFCLVGAIIDLKNYIKNK